MGCDTALRRPCSRRRFVLRYHLLIGLETIRRIIMIRRVPTSRLQARTPQWLMWYSAVSEYLLFTEFTISTKIKPKALQLPQLMPDPVSALQTHWIYSIPLVVPLGQITDSGDATGDITTCLVSRRFMSEMAHRSLPLWGAHPSPPKPFLKTGFNEHQQTLPHVWVSG
ncbi:hypothetical protein Q8A73_014761 [Channa argus]|nr:hypothetical protein Q8A73_014761 [Channa argus]